MPVYDPVKASPRLTQLWSRGREYFGCEVPIMCGAMTWISDPKLVATVCNMGGFASLAGGNMPPEVLAEAIDETRRLSDRPFGANIIVIAPNYQDHLQICCDKKLSHIVFAGSMPRRKEIQQAKDCGAKVTCFASTASMAERMIRFGADALILEGSEAGGHIGHVSTIVLLQGILLRYATELPIFVAGGLAHGAMIAHLCLMGAAGAQLGTRFVVADECQAHPRFKDAFIRARAREAVATPQYSSKLPVVAVRSLKNNAMGRFGDLQLELLERIAQGDLNRQEAQYKVEEYWVGGLRRGAIDGDILEGSLMAGQSVGLVRERQPMRAIFEQLVAEAEESLEGIATRLGDDASLNAREAQ